MTPLPEEALRRSATGALLGTAVGDALGLPAENLSPQRLARLFPSLVPGPDGACRPAHQFLFGRGMVSDDTEHACMTALALAASGGDAERFATAFGWYLRFWFAAIPAGIGMATARACIKLWLGFSPGSSGVWSAGNGPCMRSPLLGVLFAESPGHLRDMVRVSTRLTHTDPKAEAGALAVAMAAGISGRAAEEWTATGQPAPEAKPSPRQIEIGPVLLELRQDPRPAFAELAALLERAAASAAAGSTTRAFATELGLSRGVGGYVFHTVPCVIHAWLRHPRDFAQGTADILACGGDTDTTAAILGGIIGAGIGPERIPAHLLEGLIEWPWTPQRISTAATAACEGIRTGRSQPVGWLPWPLMFLRNLFFLGVVLAHGFRRLLPPY